MSTSQPPSVHSCSSSSNNTTTSSLPAPQHPIADLHPAFLESIHETNASTLPLPSPSTTPPKPQHHRITKLISQLTFGLHLLHNDLAKSESACVAILQGHIETLDAFLFKKGAALSDARADITSRLRHLRVPLSPHAVVVFDRMLESREFRTQILKRNANLEYIVRRTTKGLDRVMRDTKTTLEAVDICGNYVDDIRDGWSSERLVRVYEAMRHNVNMWRDCCIALQSAGSELRRDLLELAGLVLEIESRTGLASRRSVMPKLDPKGEMIIRWQQSISEKPLPRTPRMDVRLETLGLKGTGIERTGSEIYHEIHARHTSQNIMTLRSPTPPRQRPAIVARKPSNARYVSKKHRNSLPVLSRTSSQHVPCPGQKLLKRAGSTGRMLAKKAANRLSMLKPAAASTPTLSQTLTTRWISKSEKISEEPAVGEGAPPPQEREREGRKRCKGLCLVL
ncbi:hypothetical protein EX30DRAFT_367997 [Ascodesmis nigricans]|uniref:Uncharacterized protein n=1 Tax=Ascodesmis nigricans TaxID=341454 RepID=A0A4S2N6M6_9PEZI|nr:hypothetical protein EX30DRAFT_367997 [Ascodesmis nigricans]